MSASQMDFGLVKGAPIVVIMNCGTPSKFIDFNQETHQWELKDYKKEAHYNGDISTSLKDGIWKLYSHYDMNK